MAGCVVSSNETTGGVGFALVRVERGEVRIAKVSWLYCDARGMTLLSTVQTTKLIMSGCQIHSFHCQDKAPSYPECLGFRLLVRVWLLCSPVSSARSVHWMKTPWKVCWTVSLQTSFNRRGRYLACDIYTHIHGFIFVWIRQHPPPLALVFRPPPPFHN